MTSQEVENHSSPCNDGELLTLPQARKLMVDHLTQRGYEAEFLLGGEYEPSPNFSSGDSNDFATSVSCNDTMWGSELEQGLCFYNTGDFKKALQLFQSASNDNPQDEVVYNNICATLNNQGEYKKGFAACKRAMKLRPDFKLAQNNLAWAENELAKARTIARNKEAVAINKNDAQAFNEAGHSFYRISDYHDSLRCWEKALVLEPENSANMNNVAVAMIVLKQYERAIEMLENAVLMDPDESLYQNNIKWANSLLNTQKK
jgi:tetratricopeptide (TPR) repeat protein